MIAPNTPPTVPTNPKWLWLVFDCNDFVGMGPGQFCTNMLAYIPNGDTSPGDLPQDYLNDFSLQFLIPLTAWFPTVVESSAWAFYWQTALGLQRYLGGPAVPISGGTLGDYYPTNINALIKKKTARYPRGRPRFQVPFVSRSFSPDGQRLNALGSIALNLLATQVNTNLTSHGLQFFPASYSRFSGALEPILATAASPKTSRMMRPSTMRCRNYGVSNSASLWMY